MTATTARSDRWLALDGLRGVAILLVVVAHLSLIPATVGGMVGVTLFFVLSGFLITHLLIREMNKSGRIDLVAFYGRRALRLFPALLAYSGVMALVIWALPIRVPIWDSTWPALMYLANYVQILGHDLFYNRHVWSLAVEEHFYLLWPFLVLLGATRRIRLLAAVVALLAMWRVVRGWSDPFWAYASTDTNAYALGMGCLLAAFRDTGLRFPTVRSGAALGVFGLAILSLIPFADRDELYQLAIWVPLLAACFAVVAVWSAIETNPGFLTGSVIRWFGMVSYALYLWHAPLLQLPGLGDSTPGRLVAVGLGVAAAWLSWRLIESPILQSKLRRRFTVQFREKAPQPSEAI